MYVTCKRWRFTVIVAENTSPTRFIARFSRR